MKTIKKTGLVLLLTISLAGYSQIGVGTSTPDPSAELDVSSTTTGFLPPRMTYAQMSAIVSPAEGLMVYCTDCDPKSIYYFDGTDFMSAVTGVLSAPPEVVSVTGEIWMDINLGATQVATASTDAASYGDLYQWGRSTEGHEIRTSTTTATLATTAVPGLGNSWDGLFITGLDWLSSQDDTLWQGASGTNNPCPTGYRIPTDTEWTTEYGTWSSQDAAGSFASPLKLTLAGFRARTNGSLSNVDTNGNYWSSTVNGSRSNYISIDVSSASITVNRRSYGFSVRCIKD